jgi:hypothetical protein
MLSECSGSLQFGAAFFAKVRSGSALPARVKPGKSRQIVANLQGRSPGSTGVAVAV